MHDTYTAHGAADPEAYARLMQERYGPLPALRAEQHRPAPPAPPPARTRRHSNRWPDPKAAWHREQLLQALHSHQQRNKK
ncbi:hypothetical protein [Kitasatospora xanthocidica]|uniref:hypothetical protein n=1 Tax=Kitasatospora xanthocidica TaxID=83382 RepID=UPI0011C3C50B|nr:hypothetical protein [Kitasatospora xanthocidica]